MRRFWAWTLVLAVVLGVGAGAWASQFKEEYKLSVVTAPTSAWGMGAAKFADLVKEKTGGKVNIKVYFGGQLFAGKQTNEFLLVRQGVADFSLSSTINWSPQIKELNLFALPWFISSKPKMYEALDAITDGKAGAQIKKIVEELGVTILGWGENGFRELTNRVRPIRTPEDMAGLKLRVVGSPIFLDTFKALGANPINMNWGEAITAFQQGVVDGQENPVNSVIIPYKIYEFHKFLTDWHYVVDPLMLAVNQKVWQSFDAATQIAIREAAMMACAYQKALSRVGLDGGQSLEYLRQHNAVPEITEPYKFLESKGMTIVRLSPEEIAKFAQATKGVFDSWADKIGRDLVKLAEEDMAKVQ